MVNVCYLWAVLTVGSGSRPADPVRIFLQANRRGKPTLRLSAGNICRIDDFLAHWQLSPTTVL
jgi:hypothetical protein